jgi:hypothetical protein
MSNISYRYVGGITGFITANTVVLHSRYHNSHIRIVIGAVGGTKLCLGVTLGYPVLFLFILLIFSL